jgi:hypothetical protein
MHPQGRQGALGCLFCVTINFWLASIADQIFVSGLELCTHLAAEFGIQAAEPDLSGTPKAIGSRVGAKVGAAERATEHEFRFVDSVFSHGFVSLDRLITSDE